MMSVGVFVEGPDSEATGGSRTTVVVHQAVQVIGAEGEAPAMTVTNTVSTRRRVLVVDDCPDVAELLCVILNLQGHDARAAHNGREALALAQAFSPDVGMLDISLPDISGYDVAHALRGRASDRGLHLIALTGLGRAEDRVRALASGFDQHIVKPLTFSDIVAIMAKATADPAGLGSER